MPAWPAYIAAMQFLVAAILLGVTWLDAFDLDAEPQPPDGELGEVEEGIRTGEVWRALARVKREEFRRPFGV